MPSSLPRRGRVLAVDDSLVIREILIASLEAAGYSVEAVGTGQAALAAASRETFDAVILDVDMPGIDGLAVGRALRLDPRTRPPSGRSAVRRVAACGDGPSARADWLFRRMCGRDPLPTVTTIATRRAF